MNDELQCNGLDQTGVGHDLRDTRISHPLVTKTTDSLHYGYGYTSFVVRQNKLFCQCSVAGDIADIKHAQRRSMVLTT